MRNSCKALSIAAGACLSVYAIATIICYLSPAYRYGGYVLFVSVGFAIVTFFIPKKRIISLFSWIYSISILVHASAVLFEACAVQTSELWDWIIAIAWLASSAASVALTSIIFARLKPLQSEEPSLAPKEEKREEEAPMVEEPEAEPQPTIEERAMTLEEIAKAKKLLDSGAITPEEFYELKRRGLH